ncbi:hypothetical protein KCP73_00935 [Salmonella enterica subsp. enterica]|nr:hypothetical protein KCP73_00935 [Salmonella enterica subsp. enterica]
MAMSAVKGYAQTTFFGAPARTLPGAQRHCRTGGKTGRAVLADVATIEESADTFSIGSLAGRSLTVSTRCYIFGCNGNRRASTLMKRANSGLLPSRAHELPARSPKSLGAIPSHRRRGGLYWLPHQIVLAMVALINNGKVLPSPVTQ